MARPRGALVAWWNKRERDLSIAWDRFPPDGHMLFGVLDFIAGPSGKTFRQELEDRGYDITTLRFSIERKKP